MKIQNRVGTIFACFLLFAFVGTADAWVIPVGSEYEVGYGINMNPGTSNGSDVQGVFIFEWDDTNFNVDHAFTIAGRGNTYLRHIIGFDPTSALLIGYGAGVPGIGDEKDHLYTITSTAFASTVYAGQKWSETFPGVPPSSRVGHSAMIGLLKIGDVDALSSWVKTEGYRAAFDPAGDFAVLEWTGCGPGEEPLPGGGCGPIGGNIPEPATIALLAVGLAGFSYRWPRRMKA